MKVLSVDEEYLKEISAHISKTLVGKICKRFEIIEDKSVLKDNVKELIYEEFRSFCKLIEAHDKGLNMTQFIFKVKGDSAKSE